MSPSSPHRFHAHALRAAVAVSALLLAASIPAVALADAADAHIPPPQDTPYPGTITIHVDATDTAQGIFRVQETVPVTPGQHLTLLYPKWIPGNHAFNPNSLDKLAGLIITANGKRVPWLRDKYDVYAFHVDVPQGVTSLKVQFQWLVARTRDQGSMLMTHRILDVKWNDMSLYPAGHYTRDITFAPSVTLPAGWKYATALETASHQGSTYTFKPTTYNTLVDSPMYAGKYFKRLDLAPGAKVPVHMDLFGASAKDLDVKPEQVKMLRALVQQEYKVFGSHHYDHYDFLVSVSDRFAHNGLEHHQSSEDGVGSDFFTGWKKGQPFRGNLFAHEYTHSWNGKFRRPADLWTPNFNVPMGDSMLWVYEGMTQYWGDVLPYRAGMAKPKQFHSMLARIAAGYAKGTPGFAWRNIQDTTNDEMIAHRTSRPYRSWQMSEQYYTGGAMIWLDVDCKIRALTNDKKSLDTFARDFYGMDNGSFVTRTYTFDQLVAGLNHVVKYDWSGFLHKLLDQHQPPLAGIEASGWKVVYGSKPSAAAKKMAARFHFTPHNFSITIGLSVGRDGTIRDVLWHGPAFKAGVGSGETLVAVDGKAYSSDVLGKAITAAAKDKQPIKLLLKSQGQYRTVSVPYYGGPLYAHLERIKDKPDYLDEIIKAR